MVGNRELYFAYGSNMGVEQMRRRCPGATRIGPARLEGHRLVFPRYSLGWRGGVASVEPAVGETVHGFLWCLGQEDLAALDRYEGYSPGARNPAYRRLRTRVRSGQEELEAWIYVAQAEQPGLEYPPSPEYLDGMLEALDDPGIPAGYREALRRRFAP